MEFKLTPELQTGILQFLLAHGPFIALAALFILTLPKTIPAISAALLEHRKLSHKRSDQVRKIRNSIEQRRPQALLPKNDRKKG